MSDEATTIDPIGLEPQSVQQGIEVTREEFTVNSLLFPVPDGKIAEYAQNSAIQKKITVFFPVNLLKRCSTRSREVRELFIVVVP